jgi:hypothetical protein
MRPIAVEAPVNHVSLRKIRRNLSAFLARRDVKKKKETRLSAYYFSFQFW